MPQAQLGAFVFDLETAEYTELNRQMSFRWENRERRGRKPMREFLGAAEEKIKLNGHFFIENARDKNRLKTLEAEGKSGKPLDFFIGTTTHYDYFPVSAGFINRQSSDYRGLWVMDDIVLEHRILDRDGNPVRINFTLQISEANDAL